MEAASGSSSTLAQVARLAGVSRATASRVFSGNPAVSLDACSAVERAAAELGYVPNRAARSIASGRRESVGVVIREPRSSVYLDPLFARRPRALGEGLSSSVLHDG